MAQTTKPLKIQVLDLIKTRLETIDASANFYREVDQVAFIDDWPEEQWLTNEMLPGAPTYVITMAEVTDERTVGDSGRYQSFMVLAVAGFVRRERLRENPWTRSLDPDTEIRAEIESDIYVAMVTPDNQLGMLARTPFPGSIDPVLFTDPNTTDHWAGVRTLWSIDYKPKRTQPWST